MSYYKLLLFWLLSMFVSTSHAAIGTLKVEVDSTLGGAYGEDFALTVFGNAVISNANFTLLDEGKADIADIEYADLSSVNFDVTGLGTSASHYIYTFKGWSGASNSTYPTKNDSGVLEWVPLVTGGGSGITSAASGVPADGAFLYRTDTFQILRNDGGTVKATPALTNAYYSITVTDPVNADVIESSDTDLIGALDCGDSATDCTPYAADSSVISVTATPATGREFVSWGGSLSGSTNPTDLTVDGLETITATFQAASGSSPVAAWPFDEGSGTSAADSSGNGNTCTITDGTWDTAGVEFNATTTNIACTSGTALDGAFDGGPMSIFTKIRYDGTPEDSLTVALVVKDHTTSDIFYYDDTNNRLRLQLDYDGTDLIAYAEVDIGTGVIDAAVTYDGSGSAANVRFYVGGVEYSPAYSSDPTGSHVDLTAKSVNIGNNTYGQKTFDGAVTSVSIYDVQLSSSEAIALQ